MMEPIAARCVSASESMRSISASIMAARSASSLAALRAMPFAPPSPPR